jgi:hypothetical protein
MVYPKPPTAQPEPAGAAAGAAPAASRGRPAWHAEPTSSTYSRDRHSPRKLSIIGRRMIMVRKTIGPLLVAVACAFGIGPSVAQDPPANPACLQLRAIDRTEVVDTRNILFYLKNDRVYQNALPHVCGMLSANRPFLYRVTTQQICDLDTITVLEQWSFGFTPTETCMLGKFKLVDDGEIETLKAAAEAARAQKK